MFTGKWFDETKKGETFHTSLTVTEAHLVLASGLFGDFGAGRSPGSSQPSRSQSRTRTASRPFEP